jgi:hypothetical protein
MGMDCFSDLEALGAPGVTGADYCLVTCGVCDTGDAEGGLYFEAFNVGAGNLVELTSDASYPTIEDDVWMDMTADVSHPALAQNIWYSNDQAFIDEIPDFDQADGYFMRWRGTITIPSDGDYGFQTRSDDGSLVIIDNNLIVNNDGWHGMQTQEGYVSLSAGDHSITIPFYEDGGGAGLEVAWNQGSGWEQLSYEVLTNEMTFNFGENIAVGKDATQSTTGWDGYAGLAVDGNHGDGAYGSGSCTHTQAGNPEWWQVDLGAVYSVGGVSLWQSRPLDWCSDLRI